MRAAPYFCPVDSCEQRLQIEKRLGSVRAGKYFSLVSRYLSLKISKSEFDRCCIATIGRENVKLHNHFLTSLLKKICLSDTTPPRKRKGNIQDSLNVKLPNGGNNLQPLCRDLPQSPRKGRTPNLRDRKFRDRPRPLITHGKNNNSIVFEESVPKIQEQQRSIELHSVGSMPPLSVEDVEDVQVIQDLSIYRRSPIRPPLGIPTCNKRARTVLRRGLESGTVTDTCKSISQLPDTCSLTKRLEQKLEMEGLKISEDAASLLNKALDVYLKRLIKPCLDLAASKSVNKSGGLIQSSLNGLQKDWCVKKQVGLVSASISDFRTAMAMNPVILGEDWPLHFERVCQRTS
ncbi:hypothetical protein TanjilG_11067 [Lupinus angustifolius]|uniref:Transcriptional coactivator Hfi1/Transcriptional adapter 1 n=1 Tax=Lupinus angustifolius TaxID=3871 RepID=A0A1J7FZB7_LUPAN|nr:PREDICTED: uncharacterized protein LOC109332440 [Lupinus angustifolius]OIV93485.1 hypothetical protein TanjilG_11067 [Lupinus angustifolius]